MKPYETLNHEIYEITHTELKMLKLFTEQFRGVSLSVSDHLIICK